MKNDDYILASLKIDNEDVSSKVAVLLVSIGKKEHEGENLAAAVDMTESMGFKKIWIVLADTLQAHSIKGVKNISFEDAKLEAKNAGDLWIENNKKFYEKKGEFNLIRWEELKNNIKYDMYYTELNQTYKDRESHVGKSIIESSKDFINRYKKYINNHEQIKNLERCSIMYLLEELPILTRIFSDMGINFIIYPANEPKAFSEINIQSDNYNIIRWCKFTLRERSFENLRSTILSKKNGFSCGKDKIIAKLKRDNFYVGNSQCIMWNKYKSANEEMPDLASPDAVVYQVLEKQKEALFSSLKLLKESDKNNYLLRLRNSIDDALKQDVNSLSSSEISFRINY